MEAQQVAATKSAAENQAACCSPPRSETSDFEHPLLQFQRFGNRAVGRLIQAKLEVSQPNDPHEQEADRVADAVVSGNSVPIGRVSQGLQSKLYRVELRPEDAVDSMPSVGGEFAAETSGPGATEEVQRSATGAAPAMTAHFEQSLGQATSSGGETLSPPLRSLMESRMGWDFSSVRVHRDARAHTLARAINARAFTLDHDIFFAGSEYRPDSAAGRHLLAHELTHVVQQSESGISRKIQRNTSCTSYPGYSAATPLNTYNCAGLALRTYQNTAPPTAVYAAIMANFTGAGTPTTGANCRGGAVKFWLWEYEMHMENDLNQTIQQVDLQGRPFTTWRDFHIVAGRADAAGADPTDVYTKNGFRRVHGPGTGPSFQPAARERALSNDASETPGSIGGRAVFKVRTGMTQDISCAMCYP